MYSSRLVSAIVLVVSMTFAAGAGCIFQAGETVDDTSGGSDTSDATGCDSGTLCEGTCVQLDSNADHCGGCGNACSVPSGAAHVKATCSSGSCELRCKRGWADENGDLTDGCNAECSPSDAGVELCNGKDDDCDGKVDEEFQTGTCSAGKGACKRTGTYECVSDQAAACNVSAGEPSAETCGDDIDNDCDGETDEADATDATTWYRDADGDGYGDPDESKSACEKPDGYVANDEDCDDTDGTVKPRTFYPDRDGDGYTTGSSVQKCSDASPPQGLAKSKSAKIDCDDGDKEINPGAAEVCDGNDTNCDGTADNIPRSSNEGDVYYVDCDGDGFAANTNDSVRACSKPGSAPSRCSSSNATWTTKKPSSGSTTDCDDSAPSRHPGAVFSTSPAQAGFNPTRKELWDLNCDGVVQRQYTSTSSCENGSSSSCSLSCSPPGCSTSCVCTATGGGWASSVNLPVGCGKSADFLGCHVNRSSQTLQCNSSTSTRKQGCK